MQSKFWLVSGDGTNSHLYRLLPDIKTVPVERDSPYGYMQYKKSEKLKRIDNVCEALWVPVKGCVELCLGIKLGGASSILYPDNEIHRLKLLDLSRKSDYQPIPASRFESLSPIWFESMDAMRQKLLKYEERTAADLKKPIKRDSEGNYTSEVNKFAYFGNSATSTERSQCEQQRLLLNILLRRVDPGRYCVPTTSFNLQNSLRIFALHTNCADAREKSTGLDIAIQQISIADSELTPNAPIYYKVKEHLLLRKGNQPPSLFNGEHSSTLSKESVHDEIDRVLHDHKCTGNEKQQLTLILTWNYKLTIQPILENTFDLLTKHWIQDIGCMVRQKEQQHTRTRERSASPKRRSHDPRQIRTEREYTGRKDQSQAHSLNNGLVFVVDVRELYERISGIFSLHAPMHEIYEFIGFPAADPGWCAGNEVSMIYQIWRSLLEGPAIDEHWQLLKERRSVKNLVALEQPHTSNSTTRAQVLVFEGHNTGTEESLPEVPDVVKQLDDLYNCAEEEESD